MRRRCRCSGVRLLYLGSNTQALAMGGGMSRLNILNFPHWVISNLLALEDLRDLLVQPSRLTGEEIMTQRSEVVFAQLIGRRPRPKFQIYILTPFLVPLNFSLKCWWTPMNLPSLCMPSLPPSTQSPPPPPPTHTPLPFFHVFVKQEFPPPSLGSAKAPH